ncbi:MAG TPA: hypothetical protein VMW93_01080 [bacterium]|nr:hypothetical protein [bacterium]
MKGSNRGREVWLETLRRLSLERKLEIVMELMEEGFELRVLGVRLRFPEMSEAEAVERAKEEAIACFKKNSLRKSPLF